MRKTVILAVINVILVACIVILGFKTFQLYQYHTWDQFIQQQENQLKKQDNPHIQKGKIGTTIVSAAIPKNEAGQPLETVRTKIEAYVQGKLGKQAGKKGISDYIEVRSTSQTSDFPTVTKHVIHCNHYRMDGTNIRSKHVEEVGQVLLTAQAEPFDLSDLVTDVETLRPLFEGVLSENLDQIGVVATEKAKILQEFQSADLTQFTLSYSDSQIFLLLPKETYLVEQIGLPISSYFPVVNSQYLTGQDLENYQTYLAEEKARLNSNMIALTFDDGPNPATTPLVLDILKKYQVKATFFVLGQSVAGNEAILQRMVAEGHEIANHSWSHPNLTNLSATDVAAEIQQTQSAIEAAVGFKPSLMRPPYGAINATTMASIQMPIINWSIDSKDWQSRNATSILKEVQAQAHPGGVLLLHDIHQSTVDCLDGVLSYLLSKGYTIGTASQVLGDQLSSQRIYYSKDNSLVAQ
ncbi:polysaccharide deacetylase family protein [Streptococcus suis]|uniref:polysaccharide deacetylase family protein n=1 Tax=Streptococcus suis TaxID=1307 RepID=UPI001ABEC889|nr:polysaccharide deacetylase family protein [Streptococcus suis]